MKREKLSQRCRAITQDVLFEGQRFVISVQYDDHGAAKGVFADPAKGSVMSAFMADCCVVVSLLLQRGADAGEIGNSLGRVPDPMRGPKADKPASPMGVIVDAIGAETKEREACDDA